MEALSYCQLMERCLAAEARVVELESRTMKLPDSLMSYGDEVLISDIIDAIRTAGIKWEVE
nr:MAG TPA: hypothetical protein [Caudoviricetes sp.]